MSVPAHWYLWNNPLFDFIFLFNFFTREKITWISSFRLMMKTDQNTIFYWKIQFSTCLVWRKTKTQKLFSTSSGKSFLFSQDHQKTKIKLQDPFHKSRTWSPPTFQFLFLCTYIKNWTVLEKTNFWPWLPIA